MEHLVTPAVNGKQRLAMEIPWDSQVETPWLSSFHLDKVDIPTLQVESPSAFTNSLVRLISKERSNVEDHAIDHDPKILAN